jgi:hypothetical protein
MPHFHEPLAVKSGLILTCPRKSLPVEVGVLS